MSIGISFTYLPVDRRQLGLSAAVNNPLSISWKVDLMSANSREAIMQAARCRAQAHGYNGLNFRDLAAEVGIKSASLYYYFPSKAGPRRRGGTPLLGGFYGRTRSLEP